MLTTSFLVYLWNNVSSIKSNDDRHTTFILTYKKYIISNIINYIKGFFALKKYNIYCDLLTTRILKITQNYIHVFI